MTNALTATGLTTSSQAELLQNLTDALTLIYGSGINISSDTPDGQWLNILVQVALDIENLITQVYNSFDPDTAVGVVLDQRVAINGIQRQAATYSVTNITVVVATGASVNLYGLNQTAQAVYTVSDAAGNRWQLLSTVTGVTAGTYVYSFRSAVPGAVLTVPNTITVQVTVVLGVASVNNPTTYTSLGTNEESDAALRLRRQISVSLASQGYLEGLLAALQNVDGVTSAFVYENVTSSIDADLVPGHSIWVIVAGTGADEDIANAIYTKRNAGCGMKGDTTYDVFQIDGTLFTIRWDTVITIPLFIKFTASSLDGIVSPNVSGIRTGLVTDFTPGVYSEVNINGLATVVQEIDPNTLVTSAGFSTGLIQNLVFSAIAASGAFVVKYNGVASASINWNDNLATIQSKIDAIDVSTTFVVSGSIASQLLTITIGANSTTDLFIVTTNTLLTGAAAAITVTPSAVYSDTLQPSSKQYQFVIEEGNIIITPMILGPSGQTVVPIASQLFTAQGGFGAYTYSILINNSGGSINATTGLYTAGATNPTNDTIKVADAYGNTATVTVQVAA